MGARLVEEDQPFTVVGTLPAAAPATSIPVAVRGDRHPRGVAPRGGRHLEVDESLVIAPQPKVRGASAPATVVATNARGRPIDQPPQVPAPRSLPGNPAGVTRGRCGGCGTVLTLPAERPLKATCPGCGRTKMLV
jgi:hypothetical protein